MHALRYIYQKPYVEFFCSPENFQKLRQKLDKAPTVTYMAVNAEGEQHMNVQPSDVNAVTWGVFPAKEIVQPTVVDPQSFSIWKVRLHTLSPTRMGLLAHCLNGMPWLLLLWGTVAQTPCCRQMRLALTAILRCQQQGAPQDASLKREPSARERDCSACCKPGQEHI